MGRTRGRESERESERKGKRGKEIQRYKKIKRDKIEKDKDKEMITKRRKSITHLCRCAFYLWNFNCFPLLSNNTSLLPPVILSQSFGSGYGPSTRIWMTGSGSKILKNV